MDFLRGRRISALGVGILAAGFVFLYFNLFTLHAIPYRFQPDDATTYMFNACRMLRGKVIYRDFFQFTPPATEAFYFLLFKIFGVRAWIPNAVLMGLGLSMAWLMMVVSRKVIPGKAAYLAPALFLVISFRRGFDPTHHWFSVLAVMAALAVLVGGITPWRVAGAGALCGVAMCFTPSTGLPAVLGLALFLLWRAATHRASWRNFRKSQLRLWSAFATVTVLFNAYFVYQAGLGTFLHDTVVFGVRYWHYGTWNKVGAYISGLPPYHGWYRIPALAVWFSIYLLTPLIYILFFVRNTDQKAERPSEPWELLMLIATTGTVLFLGVMPAPSWLRMCVLAPFGLILFVWFVTTPGRFRSLRLAAVWVAAAGIALGESGVRARAWRKQLKLPIGSVAVMDRLQYEQIKFLLHRTKPGDYFFGSVELNYLLDLRNPSPVPSVSPTDYTRPEQVRETVEGLERHSVKYVMWFSNLDMPAEAGEGSNNLAPLRAYLHSHYRLVKSIDFGGASHSFWERFAAPAGAGGTNCDGRAANGAGA